MARPYSDISLVMSESEGEKSGLDTTEIVKLFDSENELDESFSGFENDRKMNEKECKKKVEVKAKEPQGRVRDGEKGPEKGPEYFKRTSDEVPSTSKTGTCKPDIDENQQFYEASEYDFDSVGVPERQLNIDDVFSNHNQLSEQFVIDNSEVQGFEMPKIFEDQTKFSEAVSDNSSQFVTSACTQKADVSSFIKETQIPVNCKSLVPPLINPEIWSCLFSNIQQRDKSLQDVKKVLGMAIVPLINLNEMLKTCRIDLSKAKQYVAQALALSCNTFFELNIKRRYFIRPYVNKRFQQLCSSTCPIGEQLFPNDVRKRMKEISDASNIHQYRPQM
ncbi:unnamed protein product [Mytilus coruscus]|uniref:Uncharacterized protein n=1 Tax=Mytilus coruscus TaxID=42192 RepID=A0A6J8BJV8_MYTCO|nr:unnamed protein product [Mytilus coruscus]